MKITVGIIKDDIVGEKFSKFVNEFPDLMGFFKALKQKPTCDGCIQKAFTQLSKQPDLEKKLRKIYGMVTPIDDEVFNYHKNIPTISSSQTEAFLVKKDDYPAMIEQFCQDKIVRLINTIYIFEKDEIMVTIVYNMQIK